MSRQELADALFVSLQTVYRWENGGRQPDIVTLIKLSQILAIDVNQLISPQMPELS